LAFAFALNGYHGESIDVLRELCSRSGVLEHNALNILALTLFKLGFTELSFMAIRNDFVIDQTFVDSITNFFGYVLADRFLGNEIGKAYTVVLQWEKYINKTYKNKRELHGCLVYSGFACEAKNDTKRAQILYGDALVSGNSWKMLSDGLMRINTGHLITQQEISNSIDTLKVARSHKDEYEFNPNFV